MSDIADDAYDEVEQEQATDEGMPEPEGPTGILVLKRGGAETEEVFLFSPPAVIGRFDPTVGPIDVDLGSIPEGAYVSRKHARIEIRDGEWFLSDLGSSNGTFKLGEQDFESIEGEAPLADGDEIALGNARFVFRTVSPSADEPATD
ncbi:MAG TPA: FHA domain-containing protein [Fimbriimonadaceae bacterium]|nr:FHA domain-containing protein [Fimbriimonadaceae bacterium]HRJ97358.1 FHA domain-containing protein [Fimbriimonadaceae bacterium]